MTDRVLDRMVRSFMATDQQQYTFGWQGGEPTLMGVDFFKRVTELQSEHGRPGSVVANGLQTNATLLTDEFARHLGRYQFLVGVSLDGPPRLHDKYRRYTDGRGSHAQVMAGIEQLKRHRVDFNILTLVNKINVRKPVEIYRYLCEKGFLFHQYVECVEFGEDGRLLPFAISGAEWGDFLCHIYDEWIKADTRRVSVRLFDSILAIIVDDVTNVCQMATDCRQYLVVEHNGDVYPCDFFVYPEFRLGNVMDASWEELQNSKIYQAFGQRKSLWNAACSGCEYLTFCAGCCQKNRPGRGKDPSRLSVLCAGWKQFYRHALGGFRKLAAEIELERAQPRVERGGAPHESRRRRIGRNAPCPCGSGKKFKNCCGKN